MSILMAFFFILAGAQAVQLTWTDDLPQHIKNIEDSPKEAIKLQIPQFPVEVGARTVCFGCGLNNVVIVLYISRGLDGTKHTVFPGLYTTEGILNFSKTHKLRKCPEFSTCRCEDEDEAAAVTKAKEAVQSIVNVWVENAKAAEVLHQQLFESF